MNSQSETDVWKRNKTIAVLLAVFFGPWTWLYTYRRDPGKAAIGLGLNISLVTIFALMVIQSKINHLHQVQTPVVAILLAIFLGPWTWLYTYKKDFWKFWPAIFVGLGGWAAWALLPEATSKVVHSVWLPTSLVIWMVAMITAISRKGEWYKTFGGFSEASIIRNGN